MVLVIDRFEGDFAVCEDDSCKMHNIARSTIPKEAKEGDVIVVEGDNITIDEAETKKRKAEIEELTEDMWG